MKKALLEEHVRYGEARFRDKELVRPFVNRIYKDLAEPEEAMKPKTCDGCKHLFFDEIEEVYKCINDVSDDVGYLHGEAVIRNIKDFHCVQHQPKDNAC